MSIPVVCQKCSAKLNAPDNAAGKRVKCPKCQTPMVVPEFLAAEVEPEVEVVDDAPPAKKPAAKPKVVAKAELDDDEDDRPRKKRRPVDDEDDDDDDRPRKKKKKSGDGEGGVSMTRNIVMGVLLVVLLGVAGYVFYDRSQKQKENEDGGSSAKKDPEVKPVIPPPPGGPAPMIPPPPIVPGDPPPKKNPPIGTPGQPTTLDAPGGFRVTFPGPYVVEDLPQRIRDKIGLPIKLYASEDPAVRLGFGAANIDFAPGTSAADRKSAYDRVVASLIEGAPKAAKETRKSVTLNGRNWEEISLKTPDRGVIFRLHQTESHIFVLVAHHSKSPPPGAMLNAFYDSFELK